MYMHLFIYPQAGTSVLYVLNTLYFDMNLTPNNKQRLTSAFSVKKSSIPMLACFKTKPSCRTCVQGVKHERVFLKSPTFVYANGGITTASGIQGRERTYLPFFLFLLNQGASFRSSIVIFFFFKSGVLFHFHHVCLFFLFFCVSFFQSFCFLVVDFFLSFICSFFLRQMASLIQCVLHSPNQCAFLSQHHCRRLSIRVLHSFNQHPPPLNQRVSFLHLLFPLNQLTSFLQPTSPSFQPTSFIPLK